jgi:hypothetical protein
MADVTIQLMQKLGIQINRESYLNIAYLGEPPEELEGEEIVRLEKLFAEDGSLIQ